MSDPHQPGTPAGTGTGDIERRAALAEALGKEVWPADRDTLVAKAQEGDAPDAVVGQLRRLPEDAPVAAVLRYTDASTDSGQ